VLKRRFAAVAVEFFKRLEPDLLRDVVHFVLAADVTAGGGNTRGEYLEPAALSSRGRRARPRNQLRLGPFRGARLYRLSCRG